MTIRVLRAGPLTTVQDSGRRGHQHEGVPECGAMDWHAARLANLLVGNDERCAVLEATLGGPSIVIEQDSLIAVTGADFRVRLEDVDVGRWRAIPVRAGRTLELGAAIDGCRAYVAFAGGIAVPEVLGSRSTYLPPGFGGHEGRALRTGDRLALGAAGAGPSSMISRSLAPSLVPRYSTSLRVIRGRDGDGLTAAARERFWRDTFTVSAQSDRMGYRLDGTPLEMSARGDVLSAGVSMGTIQLPPNGTPILLMADRQTTGGYPVLGHVATVDLGSAAQLRPGDAVRFTEISLEAAQQLYLERERAMEALGHALRQTP